ncbi:MAG: PPC domain-containing protein, partial [Chitinophagales bacterium]
MTKYFTIIYFLLFQFSLLSAQNNFEPNNEFTTAATISCGNLYESFIQELGDHDWFEVQMNESGYLSIDLTSVPANLDLHLAIITIENNEPKRIADDDDTNTNGGQSLNATAFLTAGTYYIYVTDENDNAFNDSESYNLIVSCSPSSLEVNQTFEMAVDIPQDTCFEERIWGENELFFNSNDGDNDREWFKVEIGESGYLNAHLTSVPTNLDLNLAIFIIENNQPKRIADDDDTDANN